MPIPRFYCPEFETGQAQLPPTEARHALRSLRLRVGDAVRVFDGRGRTGAGVIHAIHPATRRDNRTSASVVLDVQSVEQHARPARALTLVLSACKGERLDWLAEKCTELGVQRMILTRLGRSVVQAGPQHLARLMRVIVAAGKQCGRAWLPTVAAGDDLRDAILSDPGAALYAADWRPEAAPWLEELDRSGAEASHTVLVIGPEGGLSREDRQILADAGATPVTLADAILRVETAAVAASALWAAWAQRSGAPTADWLRDAAEKGDFIRSLRTSSPRGAQGTTNPP